MYQDPSGHAGLLSKVVGAVKSVATTVTKTVSKAAKATATAVKTVATKVTTAVTKAVTTVKTAVTTAAKTVSKAVSTAVNKVATTVQKGVQAVTNKVSQVVNTAKVAVQNATTYVVNKAKDISSSVVSYVGNVVSKATTTISNFVSDVGDKISTAYNSIRNYVSDKVETIKAKVSTMWEEVKDSAHKLMARGEAFVQEKYESASRWWQDTKEKVTNAYNTVKYYAEHPQNFVEDMSSAIKEGLHEAAEKIEAGFHAVVEGAKGLCHAVANFVQEHPFIATAILIGVLAVATFFTGGAASAILLAATKGAIMGAASGFGFGVVGAGVKWIASGGNYSWDEAVHDVGMSTFGGSLTGAITGGGLEAGKQLWSKFGGKITNAVGKITKKVGTKSSSNSIGQKITSANTNAKPTNPEFEQWLNKGEANNKVYFGIKDGQAQYTGITKQSLSARLSQHNRLGKGFSALEEQFSNLTRNQARAIEQFYIQSPNGPNLLNKINSISPDFKFYEEAIEWATTFIGG